MSDSRTGRGRDLLSQRPCPRARESGFSGRSSSQTPGCLPTSPALTPQAGSADPSGPAGELGGVPAGGPSRGPGAQAARRPSLPVLRAEPVPSGTQTRAAGRSLRGECAGESRGSRPAQPRGRDHASRAARRPLARRGPSLRAGLLGYLAPRGAAAPAADERADAACRPGRAPGGPRAAAPEQPCRPPCSPGVRSSRGLGSPRPTPRPRPPPRPPGRSE